MPVAPLGFSLQGFSPSQSLRVFSNPAALLSLAPVPSVVRHSNRSPAFRAFLSVRIRHLPARCYPLRKADALLGFHSPGISPPAIPTVFTVAPLMDFTSAAANRDFSCPPGYSPARIGWSLARLPPLMSFLHLLLPAGSTIRHAWLMDSPRRPGAVTSPWSSVWHVRILYRSPTGLSVGAPGIQIGRAHV